MESYRALGSQIFLAVHGYRWTHRRPDLLSGRFAELGAIATAKADGAQHRSVTVVFVVAGQKAKWLGSFEYRSGRAHSGVGERSTWHRREFVRFLL